MRDRLFGTDGIRAVAGVEPLTEATIIKIASAAGGVLREKSGGKSKILIGRDTRESGSWIEGAMAAGFNAIGLKPVSAGVIPTSAISALLRNGGYAAGAVISASHNPSEFNGIKFFTSEGKKIPDDWESEIENRANLKDASPKILPDKSTAHFPDSADQYAEFLVKTLPKNISFAGLRWVLDCANGSASEIAPKVFRALGAEIHALHHKPDGLNINRDCGALHPKSLSEAVVARGANGGCAFDGDADRVLFADEKGRVMDGDVLIALAARHLESKNDLKHHLVVATVMANLGFHREMEKSGIKVMTVPVGDKAVSEALESSGAVLGGEQSGHIIFKNYLSTGDGILTALQILSFILEEGKNLSEYTEMLPKFPQILLNLKVRQKIPVEKCPELELAIKESQDKVGRSGRILVRYSGTEPLLRIMVEADTEDRARRIAERIAEAARRNL